MVRRRFKLPGAVLVTALVLAGIAAGGAAIRWNRYHIRFDPAAWRSAPRNHLDDTRHRMLRSLLREHPLVGMTRDDAMELLGPANETPLFPDYDLHYLLGPEFGQISLERMWLLIKLDDRGRVREYRLVKE